ncbi:MAG: ferric reductase-like transmembrane domain-containing protein [Halieaceae bacterium]|jgi:DMSO/TMAO reductase YedYZ heme-binding membrane subunit|nr:ferric reductase-like transmembrane domain-containing protein [Halieaceae bacterium]
MKRIYYWPTLLGFICGVVAVALGHWIGANTVEQWQLASRYTAQVSFPLFIVTFVASSLVRLFPSHATQALMRQRRWWGLGFAACFFLHLAALLVYNGLRDNLPPVGVFDRGVIAYAVLLAMVLTSTKAAQQKLGRWWRLLHSVGMWGFFFIFVVAFYLDALLKFELPAFEPFSEPYTLTGIVALALRIGAWLKIKALRKIDSGPYRAEC